MANPSRLPSNIAQRLRQLRRRIRRYVWLQGLTLAVSWIGLAYWVGLALDYLPVLVGSNEMPRAARIVLMIVVSAGLLWILYRWVLRRAFVRLGDHSLALLLERRFPELNDSLLTAVSTQRLPDASADADLQEAMVQRAVELADSRTASLDPGQVLNPRPLMRAFTMAAVAIISITVFATFARDACATWTSRFLLLSDAPWPRRAHVEVLDFPEGSKKVGEGSDVLLRTRADANRPWPPPEICTIAYRKANGETGRVNMSRDGDVLDGFQYYRYQGAPFQGMLESVDFDVVGFDHRVSDLRIDVVPTPSIVEVNLHCEFPDYLRMQPRTQVWVPGTTLPIGTQVTLSAKSTKPLQAVTAEHVDTSDVNQLTFSADAPAVTEFELDLGKLLESTTIKLELLDQDQVRSDQPYLLVINAIEDLPPRLDIRLQGIGTAITPEVRIPAVGEIIDDYGVNHGWFQAEVPDRQLSERFDFQGKAEGEFGETLDFQKIRADGVMELKPGDKLLLAVRASDDFDLDDTDRVGSSDNFPLDVVTSDELLALLEARELGLKQRFEQIIRELTETRDSLLRFQASLEQARPETPDEQNESTNTNTTQQDTLRLLRVQRAQQQAGKSEREVAGVAESFADIREELINNRVDTPERTERLEQRIVNPLNSVVDQQFPTWLADLATLEEQLDQVTQATSLSQQAVLDANELIFALEQVLQNMLELETYNELLDLVRSIIKEQQTLEKQTTDEHKRRSRALLQD